MMPGCQAVSSTQAASKANRSPWHDGEIAIQKMAGAAERMGEVGKRVIRDHLIDQHIRFYADLSFVVLATVDGAGDPWATIRVSYPGFLSAADPTRLDVRLAVDASDPVEDGLRHGGAIGLLGIDLATRRRNRLNGTVDDRSSQGFSIRVEQSFGNCPRYISERQMSLSTGPAEVEPRLPLILSRMEDWIADIVRQADTAFVASSAQVGGLSQVDVSHRGGCPGFIRADADGGLTVQDYPGNLFFNTLGNFVLNPKAGLTFVGFERGDLLQMTGDVEFRPDPPKAFATPENARHVWRFFPRRIVYRERTLRARWTLPANVTTPLCATDRD